MAIVERTTSNKVRVTGFTDSFVVRIIALAGVATLIYEALNK